AGVLIILSLLLVSFILTLNTVVVNTFVFAFISLISAFFILFIETPTPLVYTLSLHDALPILFCRLARDNAVKNTTCLEPPRLQRDRKSTRLNSSHVSISYAVFCLKKKIIINAN